MLFHKCGKVLFVLFVVRGIVEFHSVESELFKTAEQHIEAFVEQVFFRVRYGSETAVFFYEFHRLDGRKSFCLAIRFCPGFKVSVESVVNISAIPFFHELARNIHTPESVCRKVDVDVDSEVFEFLTYADISILAHILHFLQFLHEIGVFVVDIVS